MKHRLELSTAGWKINVSSALILVLVLGCPLAGGCVDWRLEIAVAILAGLALLLAAERLEPVPLLSAACVGVTGLIALQLVPVPSLLLRILSPSTAQMLEGALKPLGLYPAARPLSLDPAATAGELGKSIACTCVILAVCLIASSRRTSAIIASGLAVAGGLVSFLGLCGALANADTGLGAKFPFVNPNHMAGFLNLTAWPALGLGLETNGNRRVAWMACFALTGSGVLLSLSRGGIGAFFSGLCIFASLYFLFWRRRPDDRSWRTLLRCAAPIVGAVAIASFLGHDRVIQEMKTISFGHLSTIDKIAAWPVLSGLIAKFPLAGIGRGAFATTFPAFKVNADPFTWTHAENEWLQAFVDLGVPGGALVGAFAWTWFKAAVRSLSPTKLAIATGTAALALHNLVDFSLEILGVAVPFAVSLALLTEPGRGFSVGPKALRAFAVLGGVLGVFGISVHHFHSAELDGARVANARTSEEARMLGQAAVSWHPTDYFPQEAVGIHLAGSGKCTEGLPWLFRAMALNPSSPNSHFFAAKCLGPRKDALARREYRLAFLFGRHDALADAFRRYPSLEDMLQVVPESADGLVALGALLADHQRFLEAKDVFERAWNDYGDIVALARLGDVALALNEPELALSWSRKLHERNPQWASAYLVSADALLKLGQPEAAREELIAGASSQPGNPDILLKLSELLMVQRKFAQARQALLSARPRDSRESSQLHKSVAVTLQREGRTLEAIEQMEAAREQDPEDPNLRLELANMLAGSGRYAQAIATLQDLRGLPNDVRKKIDARIVEFESLQKSEKSRLLLQNSEDNQW